MSPRSANALATPIRQRPCHPDSPTPLPPRSANGGIRIVGDLTAITQPLPRFTQGGIRVSIDWPIAPEWADL
ncbi:MAG: hypothetical protein ACAF42_02880 [Limnothrix sp. BL-A-16]